MCIQSSCTSVYNLALDSGRRPLQIRMMHRHKSNRFLTQQEGFQANPSPFSWREKTLCHETLPRPSRCGKRSVGCRQHYVKQAQFPQVGWRKAVFRPTQTGRRGRRPLQIRMMHRHKSNRFLTQQEGLQANPSPFSWREKTLCFIFSSVRVRRGRDVKPPAAVRRPEKRCATKRFHALLGTGNRPTVSARRRHFSLAKRKDV